MKPAALNASFEKIVYLPRMTNLIKGISLLHEVVSFILANKIIKKKKISSFIVDRLDRFIQTSILDQFRSNLLPRTPKLWYTICLSSNIIHMVQQ